MLPSEILSQKLRDLAEVQRDMVSKALLEIDGMNCAAMLVEAARVIDLEGVLRAFGGEGPNQMPYPDFDLLHRGWNPLLATLLSRLPDFSGFPIQESSIETRTQIKALLYAFGKAALLKKAADMAFHGMLAGEEIDGTLRLRVTLSEENDHFLDQLERDNLEKALDLGGLANDVSAKLKLSPEQVEALIAKLVRPFETGYGTMVGYDADIRLDEHFLALVIDRASVWRSEAGLKPGIDHAGFNSTDISTIALMLMSFCLKHIQFVGVGQKYLKDINYAMSLTIWKTEEDLIQSIVEASQIPKPRVIAALKRIVATKADASYLLEESAPFVPLLIEVSKGYWLCPVAGLFRNPFKVIRALNVNRAPDLGQKIREPREAWMVSDLQHLFMGNRYQVVTSRTLLKRSKAHVTDIDAAILDRVSGELALFQLKWQDFDNSHLRQVRSKAKNFVEQVDAWAFQTRAWINDFGKEELYRRLRLKLQKGGSPSAIIFFAIGRSGARFTSYGYERQDKDTAAGTWDQFVRLRYEIKSADRVFSQLHGKIQKEMTRALGYVPYPYTVRVSGTAICFENMWSTEEAVPLQ